MITTCGFCHKVPEIINHTNSDLLDVYLCEGCIKPNYDTRFRHVCYKGETEILATTVRIDEFFVVINYHFNFTTRRTNYTRIYKKIIGILNGQLDLEPITWGPDLPVCDLDFIVKLPWDNPALVKEKLQIYTTFS